MWMRNTSLKVRLKACIDVGTWCVCIWSVCMCARARARACVCVCVCVCVCACVTFLSISPVKRLHFVPSFMNSFIRTGTASQVNCFRNDVWDPINFRTIWWAFQDGFPRFLSCDRPRLIPRLALKSCVVPKRVWIAITAKSADASTEPAY